MAICRKTVCASESDTRKSSRVHLAKLTRSRANQDSGMNWENNLETEQRFAMYPKYNWDAGHKSNAEADILECGAAFKT